MSLFLSLADLIERNAGDGIRNYYTHLGEPCMYMYVCAIMYKCMYRYNVMYMYIVYVYIIICSVVYNMSCPLQGKYTQ